MQEKLVPTVDDTKEQIKPQEQLSPLQILISKINGEGKYQLISFVIFCAMWFLTAWLLLGMSFFFDSSYTCKDPEYSDDIKCQDHVCSLPDEQRAGAISKHADSIVFQFDTFLICPDHENKVSILQDMMFIGAIFGFFVIPYVADNFGRRLAMRIAWGIGTIAVLITCVSDSVNMVGLGLFLIGFGTNPAITLCFSFINEVCLGKSRQRYGVGVQVAWAVGQTTIAFIFQTGLSWRGIMYIVLALFAFAYASIQFLLLETPMFYLKKQPEMAFETLNKMAKLNQRAELTEQDFQDLDHNENTLEIHPQQKSLGFFDVFKYKSIRWTSISAAIIFFSIQAMYYSSTLNGASVGFDKVTNQLVFGIGETLGYLSASFIIDKCYRKKATFIGLGVSSGLCIVLGVMILLQTPDNQSILKWFETGALMLNRFVLCCFWSIFFVYVAELYPTQIRSLGFGWTSIVGLIGSAISPFVKVIADAIGINQWFPPAIFGILAVIFTVCLKESFGLPMKDTIQQRITTLKKQKSHLDIDDPEDDDDDIVHSNGEKTSDQSLVTQIKDGSDLFRKFQKNEK